METVDNKPRGSKLPMRNPHTRNNSTLIGNQRNTIISPARKYMEKKSRMKNELSCLPSLKTNFNKLPDKETSTIQRPKREVLFSPPKKDINVANLIFTEVKRKYKQFKIQRKGGSNQNTTNINIAFKRPQIRRRTDKEQIKYNPNMMKSNLVQNANLSRRNNRMISPQPIKPLSFFISDTDISCLSPTLILKPGATPKRDAEEKQFRSASRYGDHEQTEKNDAKEDKLQRTEGHHYTKEYINKKLNSNQIILRK